MELLQTISVCGVPSFHANITNGGGAPTIQWKVNGTNAGAGNNTETFTGLNAGDAITCVVTANNQCQTTSVASSNTVHFEANTNSSVTATVCKDSLIIHGSPVTTSGTYIDTTITAGGCDSIVTYNLTVLNNCTVGINNLANNLGATLYPNPNTGNFAIKFNDNEEHTIEIYNAMGTSIARFEKVSQQKQLDLNTLASGVYLLTVSTQNHKQQLRFVVAK